MKDQYNDAHRLLQAGKFGKAREAFEAFIEAHPKNDLTDNAYILAGRIVFFEQGLQIGGTHLRARLRPLSQRPTKAPALLLKLAAALAKSDKASEACKLLKNYAKTVPKSSRDEKKQAKTLGKRMHCK